MIYFDVAQLNKQSLFELRKIGRNIGVPSPTILKKSELIEAIVDILEGNREAVARSNRGRPVLSDNWSGGSIIGLSGRTGFTLRDSGVESVFDSLLADSLDDRKKQYEAEGLLEISVSGFGIVCINGFMQSDNDIYLGKQFIKTYSLRPGVRITGTVAELKKDFPKAMIAVSKIDGSAPDDFLKRVDFDKAESAADKRIFSMRNDSMTARVINTLSPLVSGGSSVVFGDNSSGKSTLLRDFIQNISDAKMRAFVLTINETDSNAHKLADLKNCEILKINTFDDSAVNLNSVKLFINAAKRAAETADTVICIDSLTRLASIYSANESSLDNNSFKNIFSLFNELGQKTCGSLSLLATADLSQKDDEQHLAQEVKRYADSYIQLDSRLAAMGLYPAVSLNNTFFKDAEKYLDEAVFQDNLEIRRRAFEQNAVKAYDIIKSVLEK